MNSDQERKIVEAVLNNNKRAFERLVKQYERLILHIIFPIIKNNEDKKDLLQEILIRIFQNLKSFRYKSKLSTWIGNIAYNTTINYAKKKKLPIVYHETLSGAKEWENENLNPEQELIAEELETKITLIIERLPAVQQLILRLFHNDEMTLDEICEITKLPVNTVKSHLFRGRLTIKHSIQQ